MKKNVIFCCNFYYQWIDQWKFQGWEVSKVEHFIGKNEASLVGRWIKMHLLWGSYGYFLERTQF